MSEDALEVLVGRAAARSASDDDWAELESRIQLDPEAGARLVQALRVEQRLERTGEALRALADGVREPVAAASPRRLLAGRPGARRILAAAAAILVVVSAAVAIRAVAGAGEPPAPAGFDAAFAAWWSAGEREQRLLGELPPVTLRHQALPGGAGIEVVFVRRILERKVVDTVYEIARGDSGDPVACPVDPARLRPAGSF